MDLASIKALIEAMAASDLAELEVHQDGWTLRLTRRQRATSPEAPTERRRVTRSAAARPSGAQTGAPASAEINAPLSGVLHFRPSPNEPPLVEVGSVVEAGDPVCIIEAMKMFNMIRAERSGTVAALLVAAGTEVGAGQAIMLIA